MLVITLLLILFSCFFGKLISSISFNEEENSFSLKLTNNPSRKDAFYGALIFLGGICSWTHSQSILDMASLSVLFVILTLLLKVDIEGQVVPDLLTFLLSWLGLLFLALPFDFRIPVVDAFLGLFLVFTYFAIVFSLEFIFKKEMIGEGDFLFLAATALYVGTGILYVLVISLVAGAALNSLRKPYYKALNWIGQDVLENEMIAFIPSMYVGLIVFFVLF